MQSSNTSSNTGYSSSNTGYAASSTSGTSSSTTTGYAPAVDQRLKEMERGADRVVHNETIREEQANRATQERTEYIQKPTVQQPTQYVTQQKVMEQNVAPIKIKQQEVQHVQENTVIQEQPVIVKKQEVQIQKEAPVQVTKHSTQHQTLPAIEKKELIIQPVEGTRQTDRTVNQTSVNQTSVNEDGTRDTVGTEDDRRAGVGAHIKQAAHDLKEKVRSAFHGGSTTDETYTETKST